MKSVLKTVGIQTKKDTEMINITELVKKTAESSGITSGVVYITTMHTTTAITVNEGLPDLEDDITEMLFRLVPAGLNYRHARFLHSDGQMAVNAPSHLRGALLGMQTVFPMHEGKMVTGGRQTIYFVELDGPLYRELMIHVIGE
ncbi:secondary thiamine-phosphate synthase enzyme YjbQ [Neobacillus muris]|uniref:secondary thiamine-phosphate synthase enzyme YjbQ n=1 Tax=Neobacillus muris TaxID=2941334 RepID=UPI00203B66B8|nr:secondary thiamine-phosphate synthase enzyme YjbQ [Neobacillus muris]